MESIISKYIAKENLKTEISLIASASGPDEILDYLNQHPNKRGLYFLDVDLQHEMNGIELGTKIRAIDPLAKIVFITTHDELAHLTFMHKIQAMDYIVKSLPNNMEPRVKECIATAHQHYLQEKSEQMRYFNVNANGTLFNIPYDDILYFETHPSVRKRMFLHTVTGKLDFRGIISEVAKLVPEFYCCHKSFIVNPDKITSVNKIEKEAVMANGSRVPVAVRKVSELVKMIE